MPDSPFKGEDAPFRGARPELDLEKRVARLEDIEAIERLKVAYAAMCDPYDPEGFAALFTEDGVYESKDYGTHTGRDEIRDFIDKVREELTWTVHHISNIDLSIADDGNSASGRWYLFVLETAIEDGKPAGYLVTADYNDTFVKVDGRWYIKHCNPVGKNATRMNEGWN